MAKVIAKVWPVALAQVNVTGLCGVSLAPAGTVHCVAGLGSAIPSPPQPNWAKCCAGGPLGEKKRGGPLSFFTDMVCPVGERSSCTAPTRVIGRDRPCAAI